MLIVVARLLRRVFGEAAEPAQEQGVRTSTWLEEFLLKQLLAAGTAAARPDPEK